MKNKFFVLLLFLFVYELSFAQDRSGFKVKNVAYRYFPGAEIKLDHNISKQGNNVVVFLNVQTLDGIAIRNNYILSYELKRNYNTEESLLSDTIPYQNLVFREKNNFIFKFNFGVPSEAELLLVNVSNPHNNTVYSFDIPLQTEFMYPVSDIMILKEGLPRFKSYANTNDTISVNVDTLLPNNNSNKQAYAYFYKTDFKAADPPMADQSQRAKENLNIDSVLTLPVGENINLAQKGLYFVQSDTNSNSGVGILVDDVFYPKLAHIDEVTEPLIYITTRAERERLISAADRKKELDRFWLQLARTPEQAKSLIKLFYQRIRDANDIFTGYKEGWKTDQGMIYILFGPPNEVYRDVDKEEWIYYKIEEIPRLSFSFMKVKNIFVDNHYVLVRSKEYERHWYRIVDMWRKGRFSNLQAKN